MQGKFLDRVILPIVGAVLGAIVATYFQASALDKAQMQDVIELLKDPALNSAQKVEALKIYREITDRPWSLMRSVMTLATVFIPMFVMALLYRGYFDKKGASS